MVGFGSLSPNPALGNYPGENELATDYDEYLGQRVHLSETVIDTNHVVIQAEYDYYTAGTRRDGTYDLTIRSLSVSVDAGDSVQVFGIVRPDHTISARNAVVVPPGNYSHMYTVSAGAGLWVLVRLVRG